MVTELHIYQDSHESPDSHIFSVFSTFQVRTVLDLQDSWKTHVISVYPDLRTNHTTQPLFGGYPRKIKLTHDCFHSHLCAPMLQIHEKMHGIIVMSVVIGLGCASMSSFGSELCWFAPHDHLVFARQYSMSRLICKCTWAWLQMLLFVLLALWEIPQSGCLRRSVTPFDFFCTPSWPSKLFAGFFQTSCLIAVIACWVCMFECSWVPCDCMDTLSSTLPSGVSSLAVTIASIAIWEFLLVRDWRIFTSTSSCTLLVHPGMPFACSTSFSWAVPSSSPN